MKKIVICPNPHRDRELQMTEKIKKLIEERGIIAPVCPLLILKGSLKVMSKAAQNPAGKGASGSGYAYMSWR